MFQSEMALVCPCTCKEFGYVVEELQGNITNIRQRLRYISEIMKFVDEDTSEASQMANDMPPEQIRLVKALQAVPTEWTLEGPGRVAATQHGRGGHNRVLWLCGSWIGRSDLSCVMEMTSRSQTVPLTQGCLASRPS